MTVVTIFRLLSTLMKQKLFHNSISLTNSVHINVRTLGHLNFNHEDKLCGLKS